MYNEFYGFSEKPFEITPDPRFLYLSRSHQEALASILYGIRERRGFIAVLGEAGTGKTTLLRSAFEQLHRDVKIAHIFNTDVTFVGMLQTILTDLGIAGGKGRLTKIDAINRLNELAVQQLEAGGTVVIMVDEAQNLDRSSLENLRLLSNLENEKNKLIQIILSGQPELEEKLRRRDLRQFAQRIGLKRTIRPFSEEETYEYIAHRLKVVHYSGPPLFAQDAQRLIWQTSGGIPRVINILCDNALLISSERTEKDIKEDAVREAIGLTMNPLPEAEPEPEPEPPSIPALPPRQSRSSWMHSRSAWLVLLIAFLGFSAGVGLVGMKWKGEGVPSVPGPPQAVTMDIQEGRSGMSGPQVAGGSPEPVLQAPDEINRPFVTPEKGPADTTPPPAQEKTPPLEAPGTTGSVGKIVSGPPSREGASVRVKGGDNFFRLVLNHYKRYDKGLEGRVLQANPDIDDPARIYVNQLITMPNLPKTARK